MTKAKLAVHIGTTIFLAFVFAFAEPMQIFGQVTTESPLQALASHGTCAVLLKSYDRIGFVIDSAIVETNGIGTPRRIADSCKAWLPEPRLLAAVTGLQFRPRWNSTPLEPQKLATLKLSTVTSLSPDAIDKAMRAWTNEIQAALAPIGVTNKQGEVVSLLVAFQLGKTTYFYKERLSAVDHQAVRDDQDSYRLELPGEAVGLFFAGSCRSLMSVRGNERSVTPSPEDLERMTLARDKLEKHPFPTDIAMSSALTEYEKLLAELTNKYDGAEEVGPPYQALTMSEANPRWKVNWQPPCPQ